MSARLSPDELRKIAPDVYAREFGEDPKRDNSPQKSQPKPRKQQKRVQEVPPSFWFALALALAHFAAILYLLIKY